MLLELAFRNIRRNMRRSLVTGLSVFAGAMLTGLIYGWINGLMELMLGSYVQYQTAHVRITSEEYLRREKFMPVDEIIPEAGALKKALAEREDVLSVEERFRFGILLGHGDMTVQAMGMGLDVAKSGFPIAERIVKGNITGKGIVIGSELADKLGVTPGDQLLIATKTSEGGLGGIKLPIEAIFSMHVREFDEKVFFISPDSARRLLKILPSESTEIYIYLKEIKRADLFSAEISSLLPAGVVSKTYKEQLGGMYDYLESAKYIYVVFELLILFLASFVIINTMIMVLFERMREIGTLKAIGFTEREMFTLFAAEGGIIGILGGVPGAVIGFSIVKVLSYTGINLESMMREIDMPVEYILYPVLHWSDIFIVVGMALVVPVLAAMLPARTVKKYSPSEALRM